MKLTDFLMDAMSPPVAKAVTGVSLGVVAGVWLSDLEIWVRILASCGAFFGGTAAGIYWLARWRRERKYTENESGL